MLAINELILFLHFDIEQVMKINYTHKRFNFKTIWHMKNTRSNNNTQNIIAIMKLVPVHICFDFPNDNRIE